MNAQMIDQVLNANRIGKTQNILDLLCLSNIQ